MKLTCYQASAFKQHLLVYRRKCSYHETPRQSRRRSYIHLTYRYFKVTTPTCKVLPDGFQGFTCWAPWSETAKRYRLKNKKLKPFSIIFSYCSIILNSIPIYMRWIKCIQCLSSLIYPQFMSTMLK